MVPKEHTSHRWGSRSRHERGYSTAWDKLRIVILKRDRYLCQHCIKAGRVTAATSVDHILAKAKGGTDEQTNLQSLCGDCRAEKDAIDRGRPLRRRPVIGLDGWPIE